MTADPRIEAVMNALAALAPDGDSPPHYAVKEALRVADLVDPARNTGDGWKLAWIRRRTDERDA